MPATHLISVDLPAPLSPTSAITSPARTSKSTSDSASTDPKVFVMPRSSRSGVSLIGMESCWRRPGGRLQHRSREILLAVLLVGTDAHVALLQELVLEETGVVRLRDPDDGKGQGRLLLLAV